MSWSSMEYSSILYLSMRHIRPLEIFLDDPSELPSSVRNIPWCFTCVTGFMTPIPWHLTCVTELCQCIYPSTFYLSRGILKTYPLTVSRDFLTNIPRRYLPASRGSGDHAGCWWVSSWHRGSTPSRGRLVLPSRSGSICCCRGKLCCLWQLPRQQRTYACTSVGWWWPKRRSLQEFVYRMVAMLLERNFIVSWLRRRERCGESSECGKVLSLDMLQNMSCKFTFGLPLVHI